MSDPAPIAGPRRNDGPVAGWEEFDLLLVEDDPGDALLVDELVSECRPRMTLRHARTLAGARDLLMVQRPDCILLDLNLPDSQGFDALSALRTWAGDVAVVVLTGLAEEAAGLAAVSAGAQDYLVKGRVDPEWLTRAVRYAVQRKQTERTALALHANELQAQENARLERGLLPTPLLTPGCGLGIVTRYQPGRADALLGGDFYDVIEAPDGTVHVLIGDVSGHGPDEAALGVALRIAWRTLVLSGVDSTTRLRRLEQLLVAERAKAHIFATVACLALDPGRRRIEAVRAGHPGFMLHTASGLEWMEVAGGPALGILPGAEWPIHELEMPGEEWAVVLLTDGLFEGRVSTSGDRLGEHGLLALARRELGLPPDQFLDRLIQLAQDASEPFGGLDDDLAAVHLQWKVSA